MAKTSTTPMPRMVSPTAFSSSNVVTLRSPGVQTDVRSNSPNYFSLNIAPDSEGRDAGAGPRESWSTPTSSNRSFNNQTPMVIGANTEFDAFRAQADAAHAFNLGRSSLHNISTPGTTPFDEPQKVTRSTSGRGHDRMELDEERDSAYESADSSGRVSTQAVMNTPSFFDLPRQASPASMGGRMSPPPMARSILSRLEDRHPRLSLPGHKADPPSPRAKPYTLQPRADTLPSTLETGPTMIQPSALQALIEHMGSQVLILDLRVSKLFADSRIRGALNLCLPTTLLKRASFNLQKLMETFDTEDEKKRFSTWKQCRYIVVYDAFSSAKADATSGVNTLNKFLAGGWKGSSYILRGGFNAFAKAFPLSVDRRSDVDSRRPSKMNLSLGTSMPAVAPVAGGCDMPATKSAANPFFSNIRQNQDLIGGVGQIEVKRPKELGDRRSNNLPRWLQAAASLNDHGKRVSEKFHQIEVAEQTRMTEALSSKVTYGTPDEKCKAVRIAGFEKGSKNRYNNIWPFEHARVKLKGRSHATSDDYFNASHITSSGSDKAYIAAQGPLPTTYNDFWSVIWDYDVRLIVMLTAESEGGQLKCHNYWSNKTFGPFVLKSLSEKKVSLEGKRKHSRHESTAAGPQREPVSAVDSANQDSFKLRKRALTNIDDIVPPEGGAGAAGSETPYAIVRKFTLAHSNLPFSPLREITQVHYLSWPDFGAPAQPAQVLALVELCGKISAAPVIGEDVEMKSPGEKRGPRPVLVHCSAGCGRTGTFCTIDSVLDMLKKQTKHKHNAASTKERKSASTRLVPLDELSPTSTMDFISAKMSLDTDMLDDQPEEKPRKDDDNWLYDEDIDLVEKTVTEFRELRISMVQSLKQYVLCYETLLEWLVRQTPPRPGNMPRRQTEL